MTAQLNLILIDTLLKAYGAPRLSELLRKLASLERSVEIIVEQGENEASKVMLDVLRSFSDLSGGKLVIREERTDRKLPPPPSIRVVTCFEGRLRYHGLMDGILLGPLVESLLYAGGVLEPPSVEAKQRRVEIYVIPGRPCLVTLRNFIPVVAASNELELDVIDAREYEKMGGKLPAPFVPAVVVDGKLVKVGSVKSIEEAVKLLE
ncbi:hypothetical protein Pyrfu_0396 [Pyrolobus fumarii 1A]|uniref:Thioredoxin-like fold domain-containing protein n=1 Tax=Pyrolobus fumarii (strain DSM 11204 / 1A) TaxID=694429 RepID=G0EG20_PYRF1|nr:thioredoxin family protein [Pyrolobus fumarii]AEM38268.1 hypothetical protein Pyrfu_0396 [Pyrolobus fumarii 1A]